MNPETLPTMSEEEVVKELRNTANDYGKFSAGCMDFFNEAATLITSLHTRLETAERELAEAKTHKAKLRRACMVGHSALDNLMGDTDLESDDSQEMIACNLIALTLKETE